MTYTPFSTTTQEWGEWTATNGDIIRFLIVLRRAFVSGEQEVKIDAAQHLVAWPRNLETPPSKPPTDAEISEADGVDVDFTENRPAVSEYRLQTGVTLRFVAHLEHLVRTDLVNSEGERIYRGGFTVSPEGRRQPELSGRRRRGRR